jgi:hypothetical protein
MWLRIRLTSWSTNQYLMERDCIHDLAEQGKLMRVSLIEKGRGLQLVGWTFYERFLDRPSSYIYLVYEVTYAAVSI